MDEIMSTSLEDDINELIAFKWNSTTPISTGVLASSLRESFDDVKQFWPLINRINLSPIEEQRKHYGTIIRAMEKTLDSGTPEELAKKVTRIWQRLENLIPVDLCKDTLQLWLKVALENLGKAEIDNEFLLAEAPLILFRVDERVFRSPCHFECLMHMLTFYLDAWKEFNAGFRLHNYSINMKPSKFDLDEKNELLVALAGTQSLAVVRILLELCDGKVEESPELFEIRKIACGQIHQMFIADTELPKLVHFNMYPISFIPYMVKGVPSAHVALNFIGEILADSNLERRIFGIYLMAELAEQYKIPPAFAGIELVSDVLDTLLSFTICDDFIVLCLNVMPALHRLIRLSPFSAPAFLHTLERMRKIVLSRRAFYCGSISPLRSLEQELLDSINIVLEQQKFGDQQRISQEIRKN